MYNISHALLFLFQCTSAVFYFNILVFQTDMLMSLSTQKATVNDTDLNKLEEFTNDFGQEG